MNIFTRLSSLAAGLLLAASAWADVPFKTTTVTDGQFAASTTWYTMTISANNLLISDNNGAESIALGGTLSADDANLWCFVGDDTNGYKIYNKQAGATKALAAPTTMSGSEGGSSYAILKDIDGLESGYTNLWDFAQATKTNTGGTIDVEDGWLINEHGYSSNILNNRDNKLAFWSGGYDNGSAVVITATVFPFTVDLENGSFTSGNAASTYFSVWTSTATAPQLTLSVSSGANNMQTNGTNINLYSGSSTSSEYVLSAGSGYVITGYSFTFKNASSNSNAVTITAGDQTYNVSDEEQSVSVTGLTEQTASFTQAGHNHGVLFTNFTVTVAKSFEASEAQTNLFVTDATQTTPYRIPAIAKTYDNTLLAMTDYRPGGSDIGYGRVDLAYKTSADNGKTWSEEKFLVKGTGTSGALDCGYGDIALVADRASSNVLVMCACGNTPYPSASRTSPISIARFRSADNGANWTGPEYVTEDIYSLFDEATAGQAQAIFFSSGRLFQSSVVKVGEYYRIYSALCTRPAGNYVVYSDDFGETWKVLGGVGVAAVPGGDEAKCEELPDGSVIVSSRTTGGRYFNIFTYSSQENGEGQWATKAFSGKDNNGTKALNNACNGEIMILPAVRNSDQQEVYVALQSVPFGSSRTNVGIYYKELSSYNDFCTPDSLSANWDGKHQASYIGSAYSTMAVQANDSIAFYYEESTFGKDYTEVYKVYSLEDITDGQYTYKPGVDREAFLTKIKEEMVTYKTAALQSLANVEEGKAVGMVEEGKKATLDAAVEGAVAAYTANPTDEGYANALAQVEEALATVVVKISETSVYTLENKLYPGKYLSVNTSSTTYQGSSETGDAQKFIFLPREDGQWVVYNVATETHVGPAQAMYAGVQQKAAYADAGIFTITSGTDGWSTLVCTNPVNASIPAIHLSGENLLVQWYADADASMWKILSTGEQIESDIQTVENAARQQLKYYDLQGRRLNEAPAQGIFITSDKKKHVK